MRLAGGCVGFLRGLRAPRVEVTDRDALADPEHELMDEVPLVERALVGPAVGSLVLKPRRRVEQRLYPGAAQLGPGVVLVLRKRSDDPLARRHDAPSRSAWRSSSVAMTSTDCSA